MFTHFHKARAFAAAAMFAMGAAATPAAAQTAPLPIAGPDAGDAVPGITDGVGREVFETAGVAGQALDRRLDGDASGVWGQFVVRGSEQQALSSLADGYDSDQIIVTAGADFEAFDGVKLGVVASYADISNQDVRGDTTPTETSDAESLKLGIYAGVEMWDRGFLNAEFAYLTGEAETARNGAFGAIASEFGFEGFFGRATLGYDLLPDENVSITPTIGISFARVNFDDAQETGGFNFLVERGDAEYAELRGGVAFGATLSEGVKGFISGTMIRDLEGSIRSFRLNSTQLPTFSMVLPRRELDRFELAAGVSVDLTDDIALDLGYQGDFNDGYAAHAARASVRIAL